MTAGGLEAPIAKAAASAVSRAVPALLSRAAQARNFRRAGDLLDPSEVVLPDLTSAQAASVAQYVESRDFHVVAVQLALSTLATLGGQAVPTPGYAITQQLTEGLRARGEWPGGTLRQVVEVLNDDLIRHISGAMWQLTHDRTISAGALARFAENAGDHAAAAVRNSSLLERLASLEAIHRFEGALRGQIRALGQNMRVPNAGRLRYVGYEALYVEPVLNLIVVRTGLAESIEIMPRAELLDVSYRTVILGDPGGGKSTLAAKTVYDLATDPAGPVPLLLVLRDCVEGFRAGNATIAGHLADLCRSRYQVEPPPDAIEYLLLNGRALVIFDGLDEVLEAGVRAQVIEAIHAFAHRYPNTQILVTSRKIGYDEFPLDAALFPVAELREFSDEHVQEYVRKWFALDEPSLADKFIAESELVADLRTNPLMLSLMCGLYRAEGYIPANRPDVYEKCALLLFERWDKQRGIIVPLPFDAHIRQAIQLLAWRLYTEPDSHGGLTRGRLLGFMTDFLHRERFADRADAENAAESFIDFCTGRAWVLSKMGMSGDQEVFGFTHRTFLEYFAATHMVRKFPDAARLFEQLDPHLRQSDWEVVAQLALQTLNRSVENGANDFLDALVAAADQSAPHERSNLLAFAARALTFVVPNPAVVRRVVSAIVTFFLEMPDADGNPQVRYLITRERLATYDYSFIALRRCTGELAPDIGRTVVESIAAALDREPVSDNVLLVCEAPMVFLRELSVPQSELDELDASYHTRLRRQPFIWHDAHQSLNNALPVGELLGRHGARALYLTVHLATGTGAVERLVSVYSVLAGDSGKLAEMATELVRWLTSCAPPWVHSTAITTDLERTFVSEVVPHGEQFAALLLLTLPLIECSIGMTGHGPSFAAGMLGGPAVTCEAARMGWVAAERIRDGLAEKAVPPEVADFVVRWANREFSLVADA
jgi:hypothetical protein